jgi:glycosyltransferase involved in cell wall biosynthesis
MHMAVRQARRIVFAIPGELDRATGGYAYARHLIRGLPAAGWQVDVLNLDPSFPNPDNAAIERTRAALAALPPGSRILFDGLAFGALPADVLQSCGHTIVALIHHPLALETGLERQRADALVRSERAALACAAHVVTTSQHTARTLVQDYGIAESQITVALPGTEPAERASPPANEAPLILSVGAISPRKGHADLVEALGRIKDKEWRAVICGDIRRDPKTTAEIEAKILATGLRERVTLAGEVDPARLDRLYRSATIVAMAAYHEGYGMAFAEALRRGLPIVGYAAGAVPDTVGDGGLLVKTGDRKALAEALGKLLDDPQALRALANAAYARGQKLTDWKTTTAQVAAVFDRLARRGKAA